MKTRETVARMGLFTSDGHSVGMVKQATFQQGKEADDAKED